MKVRDLVMCGSWGVGDVRRHAPCCRRLPIPEENGTAAIPYSQWQGNLLLFRRVF